MAALTFFTSWKDYLTEGVNCASDQFVVALTNTAPTAGTDTVLANITEIAYTNLSSRNLTTSSSAGGVLTLADLTLTASGAVGPFRYVVVYDSTVAGGPLLGFYDYGSSISLANGETFLIDFSGGIQTIT